MLTHRTLHIALLIALLCIVGLRAFGGRSLVECSSHANFDDGGRPGSYDCCGLSNRLDYIFLSPSLVGKVNKAGVFRKGLWGGRKTKPDKWATYPEMLEAAH